MRSISLIFLLAVACVTTDKIAIPPPPPTRVEAVVEQHHGREVSDPYRWMETASPDMTRWLEEQDRRARATFAAIPERDAILQAITRADRGITRATIAGVGGSKERPRIFLWKRPPDAETAQIWMRDDWSGADRLLIDPKTRDTGAVHHSIDYVAPSLDGRYLAYGISASGSED